MNKYIGTWVYLDSEEEKSKYPNNKGDSTSPGFQAVYWRCVVVFFETSIKQHKDVKHILFTNTSKIPIVDGIDLSEYFEENEIEVVTLKNLYPLPNNYFGSFRNQFFEFTIIDHLSKKLSNEDMLLLLDSDCVFNKPLDDAFDKLQNEKSALTYIVDHERKYQIHGVSGDDMKILFSDYGVALEENPYYSGGELLFAKGSFFKNVANEFPDMFKDLIDRHENDKIKFNEEAHVLSFFYYKYESDLGAMDGHIKRMWTNKNYFRNVEKEDQELAIWHLPNEKKTGFHRLFGLVANGKLRSLNKEEYHKTLFKNLLHPSNYKTDYVSIIKNKVFIFLRNVGLKEK